jgi:flagellar motility protein MotE (MotC chaperone)
VKNFLVLGLLAFVLFSVSAAMSLWLNQSKQTEPTAKKEEKPDEGEGKKGKKKDEGGPKEMADKPVVPKDTPGGLDVGAQNRARQERLDYQKTQVEVVQRDLQVAREENGKLLSRVMVELKGAGDDAKRLDLREKELKDKLGSIAKDEEKNYLQLAGTYEAMAPENAAPVFKEMAEKGNLDMAAKIISKMKERSAARVFDAMNDPGLVFQIMQRMKDLRPAPPAPPKGP